MPQPQSEPDPQGGRPRFRRPAPLKFDPVSAASDPEHFFDLESVENPSELLRRATELAVAFRDLVDGYIESHYARRTSLTAK